MKLNDLLDQFGDNLPTFNGPDIVKKLKENNIYDVYEKHGDKVKVKNHRFVHVIIKKNKQGITEVKPNVEVTNPIVLIFAIPLFFFLGFPGLLIGGLIGYGAAFLVYSNTMETEKNNVIKILATM